MKNIVLSAAAVLAMSSFAVAGGDIAPVVEEVEVVVEPVVTDSGFYLGLGYGFLDASVIDNAYINDVSIKAPRVDDNFGEIMVDAGYKFNSYVAIEGRYWFGISDNAWLAPGQVQDHPEDSSVSIDAWGIYVKPMYPVTDAFDVYALLGYGSADLNIDSVNGVDYESPSADGFSWGLGASYAFTDSISAFADYTSIYNNTDTENRRVGRNDVKIDTDTEVAIITIGLNYTF